MTTVLLPSWRADGDWRDLDLAVHSLAVYAPHARLMVGWRGPSEPLLGPRCTLLRRPDDVRSSSAAVHWLASMTDDDDLVVWSDDCVACPDTVRLLLEDVAAVRDRRPAMVAARSAFAAGVQNVRVPGHDRAVYDGLRWSSEAEVLRVGFVAPYVAWLDRASLTVTPPVEHEWYSDNLACDLLTAAGWSLWVSRAFVHHVGMRSSQAAGLTMRDMDRLGRAREGVA